MFNLLDSVPQSAVIKVIGVGGGGGNAVEHMVKSELDGVDFMCANTDAQALVNMSAHTVIQLGGETTKGLGAGANPDIGRQAAIEDRERIAEMLKGADMVFITAGMGGGTGTGAAPIVASVARDLGILTVAVVTKPFPFEGKKRMKIALEGIKELREHVDSLIIIPNEKLMQVMGRNCSLLNAFNTANDVLRGAVQGIADLIIRPGMINVDFADVRTVMSEMGMAMMGTGKSRGEDRATKAAEAAINSPLLEDVDLKGASGILVNITAGMDLSLGEFTEVGNIVEEYASDDATIVIGTVIDPDMVDDFVVTVVATGFDKRAEPVKPDNHQNSQRIDGQPKEQIELPSVLRRQKQEALLEPGEKRTVTKATDKDVDLLDIPTYLRRQAD
ncbi:cell division protein FtsZ [Neptunomonas phycophila]|jgi:cell division protein FtsZ|uniref:Cell division protein FtsZ n=1 Tax=Neptunomonas phycophila TaxID=1572645 RepID=A0AAW7XKD4_9GAMM|nr:cell division protein FtsZ [Neptunomonas phycophila]MBT3144083.1 cell division protein FtsZ [Neptunomonas phycophila]MDO6454686.1 cell division protein FtsZ [Neptunomonas phycophila]MDO6467328.1 cell division protein FtsZ [Neptunomonas phycophila]MDO6782742.1 cell division protein FtsZ [Neptunomonas phycophila]MDP2522105.1 cell division protein FtsZ [Neptunomonas phycophila]